MNDKQKQRRAALKKLATGTGALGAASALPKTWTKPVVDSIILPAHAATTASPASCNGKVAGQWNLSVHSANNVVNFTAIYTLNANGTYTTNASDTGTWTQSGNLGANITLTSSGGDVLNTTVTPPQCNAMTGTGTIDSENVTVSGSKI